MTARKLDPEKRASYLSAALRLFAANGVQHTSTAAIAKEAGTAAGTLFLYFPTKQDLINELVLRIGQGQAGYIDSILKPTLSAQEAFFTIWDGSIRWFLQNREAFRYIQQVRDSGFIDEATIQESEQFFGYYYQAIKKGLDENCIKPYPIDIIGGFLYQGIVAVMNLIGTQQDPDKQEEYIQIGFDIFWSGIKK